MTNASNWMISTLWVPYVVWSDKRTGVIANARVVTWGFSKHEKYFRWNSKTRADIIGG